MFKNIELPQFAISFLPLKITFSKELQRSNAESPIDLTESGIVIEVKELHLLNALLIIEVIPFSIITDLIELLLLNTLFKYPEPEIVSKPVSVFNSHVKLSPHSSFS